jgi:hypothetical protein
MSGRLNYIIIDSKPKVYSADSGDYCSMQTGACRCARYLVFLEMDEKMPR